MIGFFPHFPDFSSLPISSSFLSSSSSTFWNGNSVSPTTIGEDEDDADKDDNKHDDDDNGGDDDGNVPQWSPLRAGHAERDQAVAPFHFIP